MKIERIEPLIADAGWRTFSFLKITTVDGITGWSEYNEDFGSRGLSGVISQLAPLIVGMDPLRSEAVLQRLHVATRQARGSLTFRKRARRVSQIVQLAQTIQNGAPCGRERPIQHALRRENADRHA